MNETYVEDGYYWAYRKGSPMPDLVLVQNGKVLEFGVDSEWAEDLWEMKWRIGDKVEPPVCT